MPMQRTTTALLEGLHDSANAEAWEQLDARVRPIMLGVCRRMGLSQAEAEDAAQATMLTFVRAYQAGQYDRDRGRLRTFIVTILRSRVVDAHRRARRHQAVTSVSEPSVEDEMARFWLDERQHQILVAALQELRDAGTDTRMLAAFELYGLRRLDIEYVTTHLDMSAEAVYNAKYRITRRLQPIVARLDELYEDV